MRRRLLFTMLALAMGVGAPTAAAAPPANDSFAAAPEFSSPNTFDQYTQSVDTTEATLEPGEPQPSGCVANGGSVGRTVWMKLVAQAADGWRLVELNNGAALGTPGHELDDAVWTVWQGSSLATLTQVACDDNLGAERWPNLLFPAVNGQTYYLQIGGARASGAPEAWGGEQPLFVDRASGPPAVALDGPGNATGSPAEYVPPGVKQHWDISTSGQTTTAYVGGTTVACTVDGIDRPCSTAAGLDVTPSAGEHTIVARLVYSGEDVWATTTKRFTAGTPPATTGSTATGTTTPLTTAPPVPPAAAPVAPTMTLGKLRLSTIARTRAIPVTCALNQRGRCRVTVTIDGRTAKRLRLTRSAGKPYRLATGSAVFSAAGAKTLRLAIGRTAARRIRRARSLKLQFTTTGEYATATRSARRSVTVRR